VNAGLQTNIEIRCAENIRSPLEIGPDEVHVWRADLEAFASAQTAEAFLSMDERHRASRFHFERERRRFAAGRQILRRLLGSYLGIAGREVEFRYSAHGKPELSGAQADSGLAFNASHSGSVALFAFVRRRAVGIDVEQLRDDIEVCDIATRFFSESEQASMLRLAKDLQHEAFFAGWTRKEAFVKAKGEGLSLPLHQFDVSLAPGQPPEILATRPDADERQRWLLRDLDAGHGYAAALVVEVNAVRLIV